MTPRPTIKDVALAAGVSSATVSRVINGAATVDKELTRRVRSAVRQTGYVPNAAGRSLRRQESTQIALVLPDSTNPYFMQLTGEVERIARNSGYSVMIAHTDNDLDLERDTLAQLVGQQVEGMIIAAVDELLSDLSGLQEMKMPLVLVDRPVRDVTADYVTTDNVDAGAQAAQHLFRRGFRAPVVITGGPALTPTENRTQGFLTTWRALNEASSGSDTTADIPVLRGDLQLDFGRDAMRTILSEDGADCVFVTNNRMSAGAFEAMRGNLEAPALLATDDDVWTGLVTPSVSVVQQPVKSTGRSAARMLGERIAHPEEPPNSTYMRARILERESTQPRK